IMWAKIEIIPDEREILFLPPSFIPPDSGAAAVQFGKVTVACEILPIKYTEPEVSSSVTSAPSEPAAARPAAADGESYQTPATIGISDTAAKKLLIPLSPVYQIKLNGQRVVIGPVIGLLLGIHTHRYTPEHMEKYTDRLGIYPELGGLICAFSPKSVNWQALTVCGLFYNPTASGWEYGCFPLPDTIYRRDFHSGPELIKRLSDSTGGKLFNSYRFSKYELYDYISSNNTLRRFIPPTELIVDFTQVRGFIRDYEVVILKPVDLSRGRGICVIERAAGGYRITDYRPRQPVVSELTDEQALEQFFAKNPGFFSNYLIQRYLPLARIGDSLFDIRVVMQKHPDRTWGCTGIECRVSGDGSHLTNISRGGSALTLAEALRLAFGEECADIPKKIDVLCQDFCLYMDTTGEHFAEFGMDIAVDRQKKLWLIEANVFPSFKGFKKTDRETYLSIRYQPLLYALSLTEFGE
ncbi:MAG: YheC/YheD family protein, partial [Clostridia bacterium]|nr:YheC/YheD family protein [Clostridia bacterium]